MKAQQLKNSILHLAVQGKLVPQDPSDEPASVLLERIREEKQRLIKEGKIKKDKNESVIFCAPKDGSDDADNLPYAFHERMSDGTVRDITDKLPFDVPESWEWCRLSNIVLVRSSKRVYQNEQTSSGVPFLRVSDLVNRIMYDNPTSELSISKELYYRFRDDGLVPKEGDILVTSRGTLGLCYIVKTSDEFYFQDGMISWLDKSCGNINSDYLTYMFYSELLQQQVKQTSAGTAVQYISLESLKSLILPLPPLAEQHRIVERIEQLLPHIADYDYAEKKLTALNNQFPDQLKKSILQAAVQGKLVAQDVKDEPASVLLQRIQVEKTQLVKEGKIKKEKPLPPITEDDIPFDLPETWEWVRFAELVSYNLGKTPPRHESESWSNAAHPWVSIADMVSDGMITETKEAVSDYASMNHFRERKSAAGTLLMSFKLTVGRVSILGMDSYHNEAIISIYPFADVDGAIKEYLFKILPLISQSGNTKKAIKGNTLNSKSIDAILVPLPPLDEQCRIVERISELLPIIERCHPHS
jgi:type I restriction enzyme S subunit